MDTETAKAMLHLLLGKHWKLYPQFHQFLDQSKYKVINKDQWYNILEFSRTISSDLSNYDIDGACSYQIYCRASNSVPYNDAINVSYLFSQGLLC